MKKEELKSALGMIQPQEELIQETLFKIEEQKQREEKGYLRHLYCRLPRYAGAVCACALVLGIGLVTFYQGETGPQGAVLQDAPQNRMAENTDTDVNIGTARVGVASFSAGRPDADTREWITGKGRLEDYCPVEITEEDIANGVIAREELEISIQEVLEKSEYAGEIAPTVYAEMVICDEDTLNTFINSVSKNIAFRLVQETTGNESKWTVADFRFEEEK